MIPTFRTLIACTMIFAAWWSTFAAPRVLFLGLSGEGAPAVEHTFDNALRDRIRASSDMTVIDFNESQRLRRLIDAGSTSQAGERTLVTIEEYLPDSTLVAWGSITRLTITPVRRKIILADVRGEMATSLTVYIPSQRRVAYCGTVRSDASRRNGFVLFEAIDRCPVSAVDRERLTEELVAKSVAGCADIIQSLRKSTSLSPGSIAREDTGKNRSPSISDVFTVPSVEAAEISNSPKPPASDTGKTESKKITPPSKNITPPGTK